MFEIVKKKQEGSKAAEKERQYKANLNMSFAEKRKLKSQQNEAEFKTQLNNAIYRHKLIVRKATPFFSTKPIDVDSYAAFYETELVTKPAEDPARVKFRQMQAVKKKLEKDVQQKKRRTAKRSESAAGLVQRTFINQDDFIDENSQAWKDFEEACQDDKDMADGIVKNMKNPDYNFDLKKKLGRIDPYSEEGIELLTEDERIRLQKLWCMATRAVPLQSKRRIKTAKADRTLHSQSVNQFYRPSVFSQHTSNFTSKYTTNQSIVETEAPILADIGTQHIVIKENDKSYGSEVDLLLKKRDTADFKSEHNIHLEVDDEGTQQQQDSVEPQLAHYQGLSADQLTLSHVKSASNGSIKQESDAILKQRYDQFFQNKKEKQLQTSNTPDVLVTNNDCTEKHEHGDTLGVLEGISPTISEHLYTKSKNTAKGDTERMTMNHPIRVKSGDKNKNLQNSQEYDVGTERINRNYEGFQTGLQNTDLADITDQEFVSGAVTPMQAVISPKRPQTADMSAGRHKSAVGTRKGTQKQLTDLKQAYQNAQAIKGLQSATQIQKLVVQSKNLDTSTSQLRPVQENVATQNSMMSESQHSIMGNQQPSLKHYPNSSELINMHLQNSQGQNHRKSITTQERLKSAMNRHKQKLANWKSAQKIANHTGRREMSQMQVHDAYQATQGTQSQLQISHKKSAISSGGQGIFDIHRSTTDSQPQLLRASTPSMTNIQPQVSQHNNERAKSAMHFRRAQGHKSGGSKLQWTQQVEEKSLDYNTNAMQTRISANVQFSHQSQKQFNLLSSKTPQLIQ